MAIVAHKYMPEEMPVEELHATFAAREHTLEYLAKSLRDQCGSKTLTSYLITGPRGSGKTTIVRMVSLRIREDDELSKAWLPVRFPEELPGITSLRDLLAATLHMMAEVGITGAAEWHERVEAETDDEQSQELAITGLRQIATQQNRRLVLFIENLDLVFDRGLNERTQGTLRRLLMDSPFIMIVGTAVKQFEALRAYDEAFFNYFCPVPLDPLDDTQVSSILFRRAEYDGNEQFRKQYQLHQGRIKAISRLTGGNPRLVLMLYEALTHGNLTSTVETLRTLVDELTPLLKDILEHQFSDQQSKILDALMREGGTATPSKIAKSARLSLNTVTTQLPRLKDMQVVEVRGGGKGRAAYYTVPDQLFCTWYQMRYLRPHRRRIELFVEVLRVWFEEEERLRAMKDLAEKALRAKGKIALDAATATEYFAASLAATGHHPEAQETAVRTWLRTGNMREAAFVLAEDTDILAADRLRYEAAAYSELGRWSRQQNDVDTEIRALQAALERTPDDLDLLLDMGGALLMSGSPAEAQQCFHRVATSQAADAGLRAAALVKRAVAKGMQGDTDGEIVDYAAVMRLNGAPTDQVAKALFNRGVTKGVQGDRDGAIAEYTAVVELEGAPAEQVAGALVNRGVTRGMQGDRAGGIADCTAAATLDGAPADNVARAFFNRGVTKGMRGDSEGAIVDYTAVVELDGASADLVAGSLVNRGAAKVMLGDVAGAIADYTAVVELDGAPTDDVAQALVIRGGTKGMQGDTAGAIADCTVVVKLDEAPADLVAQAFFNRSVAKHLQRDIDGAITDGLAAAEAASADEETRARALKLAIEVSCTERGEDELNRVLRLAAETLSHVPFPQRSREIETVFLRLASPVMKSGWPRVLRRLSEGLPPEVAKRLEFFSPVADILETDDLSRLDPLPPEQREFVREVLQKFEESEQQAP